MVWFTFYVNKAANNREKPSIRHCEIERYTRRQWYRVYPFPHPLEHRQAKPFLFTLGHLFSRSRELPSLFPLRTQLRLPVSSGVRKWLALYCTTLVRSIRLAFRSHVAQPLSLLARLEAVGNRSPPLGEVSKRASLTRYSRSSSRTQRTRFSAAASLVVICCSSPVV